MTTALESKRTHHQRRAALVPRPMPAWLQVGAALFLLWNGLQMIVHRPEPSMPANTDQAAPSAPQARYDYDPYGRATSNVQPSFQYSGYYAHAPSAMSVTRMTAYAPTAGRWVERDPLPAK